MRDLLSFLCPIRVLSVTDNALARLTSFSVPREYRFFVYILSSKSRRLYTGITNDLYRRVTQHKRSEIERFTQKYRINRLVYWEQFQYVGNAIRREKVIKDWTLAKRVALIERENPT